MGSSNRGRYDDFPVYTTQYLYGSLANPFQITASRAPDNVLTVYYYDDFGALYALERGGVRYYVASDHLGTPKVITDNTGTIVRQVEYDSWGVKISDTNPSFDLPVGFAGGIPDDATGLVRFGYRDYEPGTGRWTAKDPIFFEGGQANLFVYVGNDAVNYLDRTGMGGGVNIPIREGLKKFLPKAVAELGKFAAESWAGIGAFGLSVVEHPIIAGLIGVALSPKSTGLDPQEEPAPPGPPPGWTYDPTSGFWLPPEGKGPWISACPVKRNRYK